jgi:hypothetical protein
MHGNLFKCRAGKERAVRQIGGYKVLFSQGAA